MTRKERAALLVAKGCIQPDRACWGKAAYPTQHAATHVAKFLTKKSERRFDSYRCPFCDSYHLTRRRHGDTD